MLDSKRALLTVSSLSFLATTAPFLHMQTGAAVLTVGSVLATNISGMHDLASLDSVHLTMVLTSSVTYIGAQ